MLVGNELKPTFTCETPAIVMDEKHSRQRFKLMSPEAKAFHHSFINLIFSHIVPSVFKTRGLQFAIDRLAGPFLSLLQSFEVLFSCIKYCPSLLLFTCS